MTSDFRGLSVVRYGCEQSTCGRNFGSQQGVRPKSGAYISFLRLVLHAAKGIAHRSAVALDVIDQTQQRREFAEARAAHSTGKWVEVLFASEFKKLRVAKPEQTSEEQKRKVK